MPVIAMFKWLLSYGRRREPIQVLYDASDQTCKRLVTTILEPVGGFEFIDLNQNYVSNASPKIVISHGYRNPFRFANTGLNNLGWWQRLSVGNPHVYMIVCYGHHIAISHVHPSAGMASISYKDSVGYFNNRHVNPHLQQYVSSLRQLIQMHPNHVSAIFDGIKQAKLNMARNIENRMIELPALNDEYRALEHYMAVYDETGFHIPENVHLHQS